VTAPADDTPLHSHGGILRIHSSGRCLAYTDGTPFFWLGDTWWFCPSDQVALNKSNRPGIPSMYRHLLEVRRRQGFTVLHMAFLGKIGRTGVTDFLKTLRKPAFDAGYWRTVDCYIREANDAGLIPAIAIGWANSLDKADMAAYRHLWSYVVARYGAFAVTWLVCGEYNVAIDGQVPRRVANALALGRHIRQADPYRRAMTIHPWYYLGDKRQAWTEPWYDFTMFQGGHNGDDATPPSAPYGEAYRRKPARPVIEGETNYEAILNKNTVTAGGVRRAAWHAMQHGCAGFTYGAHGLWYPYWRRSDKTFVNWGRPVPWWESVRLPGADHVGVMKRFYERLPWWRMQPWPEAVHTTLNVKDGARPSVRGCTSPLVVAVYFPPKFPARVDVTLALPRGARPATAVWFDPRTGAERSAPLPRRQGAGRWRLPARPDSRDWVLVLRAAED